MITNKLSISSFMSQFSPAGGYEIRGDKNVLFGGLHAALARHCDGLFFVIADESWPMVLRKRQESFGIDKLIKKALSKGFDSFVVPSIHRDSVINIKGVKSVVVVDATWSFFLKVSSYVRVESCCKVYAVTGSAGKTSTCDMLKIALKTIYNDYLYAAEGVNSNLFRDSVSSLSRLIGYKAAVLEVSASKQFVKSDFYVAPDVAIFTALSEAHSQYLGSMQNIAVTKSSLFKDMPKNGRVVLNVDMPYSEVVYELAKVNVDEVITYGESDAADVKLVSYDLRDGKAEASYFGNHVSFETSLKSKHMLLNSIAVMAALSSTKEELKIFSEKLLSFSPTKGRGDTHEVKLKGRSFTIIDESYNSNSASVKASLDSLLCFEPVSSGNRLIVIGDILELGDASKEVHKNLSNLINNSSADKVILIGKEVAEAWSDISFNKKIALLPDTKDLIYILSKHVSDGDVVLFKASNGIGLGKIVDKLLKNK